jgi:two-component system sensor histidine kinase ChiS
MHTYIPGIRFVSLILILCCIFTLSIACGREPSEIKKPSAVGGILDLRGWDFTKGHVKLDGDWKFCPDRLFEPEDLIKTGNRDNCGYIKVPSLWKDSINGDFLPGKGQATYHLRIIYDGKDSNEKTLIIHRIYSGYSLWINGTLTDTRGIDDKSAKAKKEYIFIHNKKYYSFTLNSGINDIVIQVFNDYYKSGGIDRSVLIENKEDTIQAKSRQHTIDMVLFSLLLFAFAYNIAFYFFRRQDISPLYFGLFCLAMALNTLNHQYPVLSGRLSFPGNPYFFNYLTIISAALFCIFTIRHLFRDEFYLIAFRISIILSAAFIILLFVTEFRLAEQIMKIYYISGFLLILYCIYVFILAIKNHRDNAALFMAGFCLMFIGGINDILYGLWIINTGVMLQYGIIIVCITTTLVMSRRFSRALGTVEKLSEDLANQNSYIQKVSATEKIPVLLEGTTLKFRGGCKIVCVNGHNK